MVSLGHNDLISSPFFASQKSYGMSISIKFWDNDHSCGDIRTAFSSDKWLSPQICQPAWLCYIRAKQNIIGAHILYIVKLLWIILKNTYISFPRHWCALDLQTQWCPSREHWHVGDIVIINIGIASVVFWAWILWDILIHCGLVTPYGDRDLGQHWLR